MNRPKVVAMGTLLFLLTVPLAVRAQGYEGHQFIKRPLGYEACECIIETKNPTVTNDVSAWVGFDNQGAGGLTWVQTGWGKHVGGVVDMYYEYTDENGTYSGIMPLGAPPAGGVFYAVRKNGTQIDVIANSSTVVQLAWSDFDRTRLCAIQFGSETHASGDHTPGSGGNPCDFSGARITELGGSSVSAPFSSSTQVDTETNGNVGGSSTGVFYIWDSRDP